MEQWQWKHAVASGVLKYCISGLLGTGVSSARHNGIVQCLVRASCWRSWHVVHWWHGVQDTPSCCAPWVWLSCITEYFISCVTFPCIWEFGPAYELFDSLLHFYCEQQSQTSISKSLTRWNFCHGSLSRECITSWSFLIKVDVHGRHIRYSPYSPKLKHSSCIVYMHSPVDRQVVFADIKMAFQHKLCGITNSCICTMVWEVFQGHVF